MEVWRHMAHLLNRSLATMRFAVDPKHTRLVCLDGMMCWRTLQQEVRDCVSTTTALITKSPPLQGSASNHQGNNLVTT